MVKATAQMEINPEGTFHATAKAMTDLVNKMGAKGAAKAVFAGVVHQYTDTSSMRAEGRTGLNILLLAPGAEEGGAGAALEAKEEAGAESALASKGGGCLLAGTLVWMADGSLRPVERVRSGDWVLTRDPATGREGQAQAAVTTLRSAGSVVAVTLADAQTGQSETVAASPEHPFFVQGAGFVPASMLAVGNAVVTRAGPPLTVTALSTLTRPGGYAVYNFVVPGDHSYFVGNLDGGAWVHNPAPCDELYIGPHGSMPRPRPINLESHHILQNEWATNNIPNYKSGRAPAILLRQGPVRHTIITTLQNARRDARVAAGQGKWSSSLNEELENSSRDLRAAGVPDKARRAALKRAYKHFYP